MIKKSTNETEEDFAVYDYENEEKKFKTKAHFDSETKCSKLDRTGFTRCKDQIFPDFPQNLEYLEY